MTRFLRAGGWLTIPAYKIAFIGDNYDAAGIPGPISFPNLYTLRGTKPRWALGYLNSLNKVLALKPEIVLQGHPHPIEGNKEITQRLTKFRDAIQYVHDETVKGMNSGKDVYRLMREIRLPANLEMEESLGKLTWSIREIYDGYGGWFDMNPTTMYEWPASTVYPDLVKLVLFQLNRPKLANFVERKMQVCKFAVSVAEISVDAAASSHMARIICISQGEAF